MQVTSPERRQDRLALWLIVPLTLALLLILVIFYGLFRSTTVDGDSMLPTLRPADRVLVTRDYRRPRAGDVVVVRMPDERGRTTDLVKRIVAVSGDTVSVNDDVAVVNGSQEPTRTLVIDPTDGADVVSTTVPDGTVYVMGDNRPVSYDSRFFGPVPLSDVQGKVVAVFAPITRVGAVY